MDKPFHSVYKSGLMNVGLVWRSLSKEGFAESYPYKIARALTAAGHSIVLVTARNVAETGWNFGKIQAVGGETAGAFARAVEESNPRTGCDFVLSFEPGIACDCYFAIAGVQRVRMAEWSRQKPAGWSWLRNRARATDNELLELETESARQGFSKIIVTGSERVKNEIIRHYHFPGNRIRVIRDEIVPVDPGVVREKRAELRRGLGLADEDFVIYCAGPELAESEYRFAIETIERLDLSQPVLLAGCAAKPGGFPRSRRTRYIGPSGAGLPHLFAADVFLQPLVYHPFSHSCLAAIAAGMPVITTRANGFSDLIESDEEGGILAGPSDTKAAAMAIEPWCDPEKRLAAGPRLRRIAAQFNPESAGKELAELLDYCVTT